MVSPILVFGGSRFDPAKVSSLAIWLDGLDNSTITKDGGNLVDTWRNKGGAGNATQSTALRKPKWVASAINGRPALQGYHDSTNASQLQIVDSSVLDYASTFHAFMVMQRVTDMGASESIASKYATTGNQREIIFQVDSSDRIQLVTSIDGTSGTLGTTQQGTVAAGTPYILECYWDGSNIGVSINNSVPTTGIRGAIFNGSSPFNIFSQDTSFISPFAGYLGELLFYTVRPSSSKQSQIRNYLSNKWGISL